MAVELVGTGSPSRRLAAILIADIAGYSRMMGVDEEGTLARLKVCRSDVLYPVIDSHQGHVVKLTGDGVLIEFPSVVEAVRCAMTMQARLHGHNAILPEAQRLVFRMGINLGDVLAESGGDVYGDGVNIAARLEGLAEPGEVLISGAAFDQVRNKVPFVCEFLGEQQIKNIAEPVRVYRLRSDAVSAVEMPLRVVPTTGQTRHALRIALATGASLAVLAAAMVLLSPAPRPAAVAAPGWLGAPTVPPEARSAERPTVAVLPFANLSGDPGLDYFADGVAEDILTGLARTQLLSVNGRTSSFVYKTKAAGIRQIGQDLGARYVVEGSVRRDGRNFRVTALLIDALHDRQVWADRYEEEGANIFLIQDHVTQRVVTSLTGTHGAIQMTESERAWRSDPETLNAYEHALRVHFLSSRGTREDMLRADAIARDGLLRYPDGAFLKIEAAWCRFAEVRGGWTARPREQLEEAFVLATDGLRDRNLSPLAEMSGHWLMAYLHLWHQRDYAAAAREYAVTKVLSGNDIAPILGLTDILLYGGELDAVFDTYRQVTERSPRLAPRLVINLGAAYQLNGENERALSELLQNAQPGPANLRWRAAAYAELGQLDAARDVIVRLLRMNPAASVASLRATLPFRNPQVLERHLDNLARAGLPET